jgi:hypothetical protein
MPGSPDNSTTWPSPLFALDQRRRSSSSSSSRPTSSVRPLAWRASKRLSTEDGRNTVQACTVAAMPLSSCAPRSRSSNRLPTSFRVLSAMTTLFASAMACKRAARLGVSPTMACSWENPEPIRSPTTTSPVAIPTRVCKGAYVLRAPMAATKSSPARTALSASSSCACGYPKYTRTPSPMYFATKPPKRCTASVTHF